MGFETARSERGVRALDRFFGEQPMQAMVIARVGLGLLLFVALFVSAFSTCRKVAAMSRANPDNQALQEIGKYASALRYSLIAFIVGGAFVTMQYNEMVWHLLALSSALDAIAKKAAEDHPHVEATTLAVEESPIDLRKSVHLIQPPARY